MTREHVKQLLPVLQDFIAGETMQYLDDEGCGATSNLMPK